MPPAAWHRSGVAARPVGVGGLAGPCPGEFVALEREGIRRRDGRYPRPDHDGGWLVPREPEDFVLELAGRSRAAGTRLGRARRGLQEGAPGQRRTLAEATARSVGRIYARSS